MVMGLEIVIHNITLKLLAQMKIMFLLPYGHVHSYNKKGLEVIQGLFGVKAISN